MKRALALCLLAVGCYTPGPGGSGRGGGDPVDPGPPPPPEPRLVIVESQFLERGLALQMEERYAEAIAHYKPAFAPEADVTSRLRARAHLRTAIAWLFLTKPAEAKPHLEAVIRNADVMPDEDYTPPAGGERSTLRRQAERRLREIGEDVVPLYTVMLNGDDPAAAEVALIALARIADARSRLALQHFVKSSTAPARLRNLAQAELDEFGTRRRTK